MNESMHLFAGIGGGLLGDLIIGHKPIIAVEWDKYACKVLRERASEGWFPDLQVYEGDVRLFNPSEYEGRIHTLHAGFPCQDISNAGNKAGVGEGTRSGLYREVLRVAGVVRPRELYLENVSAILSNGLGTVLGDLAALGYSARWICIRASDVGANHQRDRWWLLARKVGDTKSKFSDGSNDNAREFVERGAFPKLRDSGRNEELAYPKLCGRIHGQTEVEPTEGRFDALGNIGTSSEDVAYTPIQRQQGQREYVGQKHPTKDCDREADMFINGGEGRKGWWQLEPDVGRVANELSFRVDKLKGLGNAQVPLQAAVAYKMLSDLF